MRLSFGLRLLRLRWRRRLRGRRWRRLSVGQRLLLLLLLGKENWLLADALGAEPGTVRNLEDGGSQAAHMCPALASITE
jgi:hypothetical protein